MEEMDDTERHVLHPNIDQSERQPVRKRGDGYLRKVRHQRASRQSSPTDLLVCIRFWM